MQTIAISTQDMRKVARPHSAAKPTSSAAKPTSKLTTSAAKPCAILAAPWRKPSPSEKRITSAAQPSKHTDRLAPAPKRTALHAKNNAICVYQSHQARLHNLSEELQELWFTVFDSNDTQATLRSSWRPCWGRLESILKAIHLDALQGNMLALSAEAREKLTAVLEALKAHLIYHHQQTVLQNKSRQMLECFTNLVQKASDLSTWHTILDALVCDNSSESYRTAQVDLIEQNLNRAEQSMRQIATLAQQIAVPAQNQ